MKKHYKSKTAISINVVLKSKKSMHIAFTAQSDGSSVYTTDNPDVQYALEHHYKYGKLFKLVSTESEADIKAKKEAEEAAANEKKDEIRKVSVSDLAAAKDFLARRYVRRKPSWKRPRRTTLNLRDWKNDSTGRRYGKSRARGDRHEPQQHPVAGR